ncbi:hybrid sensor histidine kinase/response regulator transcription factor [Robertkochia solimangrovi]|uniref:hybrid sensor histidine kinase/response regulator transcription factor n=1 Tax=Robertkochia solimangrovi TaxID=2213046 RepID=UPI00117E7BD5|nr:hybrid sensor histidine kinase/response regulator transcription factor [Robertkochia solimangrovi]TRZ42229.1 hypothetical protein DMZ48_14465 [Robertkochia solimangrovi]
MKPACILVFLLFNLLTAQPLRNDYKFQTISNSAGLDYTWIWNIIKDREGYMWFCSQEGVFKYDGHLCKKFEPLDELELAVNTMIQDSRLNLWFGTSQGLYFYESASGETIQIALLKGEATSLIINSILQLDDETLLIGTNNGMYLVDTGSKEASLMFDQIDVGKMEVDQNKRIWFVYDTWNVAFLDPHEKTLNRIPALSIQDIPVNTIYNSSDGGMWIGYDGAGAVRYDQSSKDKVHFQNTTILSNLFVRAITEDDKGKIWFGTEQGITIYDPSEKNFEYIRSDEYGVSQLGDNAIYSLYADENSNIWIGTFFNGVSLYRPNKSPFRIYQPDISGKGIPGRAVSSIFPTSTKIYIGTEDNGLAVFDKKNQKFLSFNESNSNLIYNNIHSLLVDSNGYIWIGTYTGGLCKSKLVNGLPVDFTYYKKETPKPGVITSNSVYALLEDSDGEIWIGTRGGGLEKYDRRQDSFYPVGVEEFKNSFIWDLLEDKHKNIWVATYRRGIFKIDPKGKIQKIDVDLDRIISLEETSEGSIVVCTEQMGIGIIELSNDGSVHLKKPENLPDNTIYSFLEDNNQFWVTSNKGIHRLSRSFETIKSYTVKDGLPTNRFNYNSSAKADDWILFGSTNGMVIYDKNIQLPEGNPPVVNLSSLRILNQTEQEYDSNINYLDHITLAPFNRSFMIHYVGLDYANPDKVDYEVKLDGFDMNWVPKEGVMQATYSNIPPGNYQFIVKAINSSNGLTAQRSVNLEIMPFWYERTLSKIMFILLTLTILLGILYLYIRNKNTVHRLQLERIEKDKIKELQNVRLKFFTNISHEFKTPLNLIIGPIQYLNSKNDLSDQRRLKYYDLIRRNAERLLLLINELIEFRRTDLAQLNVQLEKVDLKTFMDEVLSYFDWMAEVNDVHLQFTSKDENTLINIDVTKFEKVVINIISNAFKFTPKNGIIEIEHFIEKGYHKFYFRNSGGVLTDHDVSKYFNRFHSSEPLFSDMAGTGIGLNYVKMLIELHKGTIEIKNIPNVETNFIVSIPVDINQGHSLIQAAEIDEVLNDENYDFLKIDVSSKKPKVLIVDDSAELRDFMLDLLSENYEVKAAKDGLEALSISKEFEPEVVVSDINMPRLNGYDLCLRLKNDSYTSHIVVILLTAFEEGREKLKAYKSGADAYITKPVDIELLSSRILNLLIRNRNLKLKYQQNLELTPEEVTHSNPDETLLKMIIQLTNDNLHNNDLDIDFYVTKLGLSKSSIYRKMKAITGQSLKEFIQTYRLKKAALLLIQTEKTIAEIAYDVGFSDPFYFSRSFKANFNLSPTDYRKTNK